MNGGNLRGRMLGMEQFSTNYQNLAENYVLAQVHDSYLGTWYGHIYKAVNRSFPGNLLCLPPGLAPIAANLRCAFAACIHMRRYSHLSR